MVRMYYTLLRIDLLENLFIVSFELIYQYLTGYFLFLFFEFNTFVNVSFLNLIFT